MRNGSVIVELRHRKIGIVDQIGQRQIWCVERTRQLLPGRDIPVACRHERGPRLLGERAKLHGFVNGRLPPQCHLIDLDSIHCVREADDGLVDLDRLAGNQQGKILPPHLPQKVVARLPQKQLGVHQVDVLDRLEDFEFAGRLDDLTHIHALVVAALARPHRVRFVTENRIGMRPRLDGRSDGAGDVGLVLGDNRAVRQGQLLELGERNLRSRRHRGPFIHWRRVSHRGKQDFEWLRRATSHSWAV